MKTLKSKVWAQYDKDEKCFTGQISHEKQKPMPSDGYKWLVWKRCIMILKEVKKS